MESITEIWQTELRVYAAPAFVLAGLYLALRGIGLTWRALRLPPAQGGQSLRLMAGFRSAIIGSAVAGIAAGWLWQVEGVAIAAALIGAGELCETSVDIWALRREIRTTSGRPRESTT